MKAPSYILLIVCRLTLNQIEEFITKIQLNHSINKLDSFCNILTTQYNSEMSSSSQVQLANPGNLLVLHCSGYKHSLSRNYRVPTKSKYRLRI